jgi:hypothetical protein
MKKTTRTLSITTAAIIGAFALTACSTPTEAPEPQATKTVTAAPVNPANEPAGFTADEQAFLDAFEYDMYPVAAAEETVLVDLANTICDGLDVGITVEQSVNAGIDTGNDPYEVGYIVGGAIEFLCPVHIPAADAYITANSGGTYA